MSYKLAVLNDIPLAYWRLEETTGTTIADASGFGFPGTYASAATLNQNGIVPASRSALFGSGNYFTANFPNILNKNREWQSFSIEAWVRLPARPTTTRLIAGRATDGLFVTPTGFEFSITGSDTVKYTASVLISNWEVPQYVIASYSGRQLNITVNNVTGVSSTFQSSMTNTNNTFYVGGTAAANATSVYIDEVAIYDRPLKEAQAVAHYNFGTKTIKPIDKANLFSGSYYGFSDATATVVFDWHEDTTDEFLQGTLNNIRVTDNLIYAGPGATGQRISNIVPLNLGTIAGSRINFETTDTNVVVETSIDAGASWQTATNNTEVSGLTSGTNTTDKFLQLRYTFNNTSATNYVSALRRTHIVIYSSKNSSSQFSGVDATLFNPSTLQEFEYQPLEYRASAGLKLIRPGYASVPAHPDGTNAIEFWVTRLANYSNGGTFWEYIFDGRATVSGAYLALTSAGAIDSGGGTFYINGTAKTPVIGDFPIGIPVHVAVNLTVTHTAPIKLNGHNANTNEAGQYVISNFIEYPTAMTATQAAVRYGMALGAVQYTIVDSAPAPLTELSYSGYNYAWQTTSSGVA